MKDPTLEDLKIYPRLYTEAKRLVGYTEGVDVSQFKLAAAFLWEYTPQDGSFWGYVNNGEIAAATELHPELFIIEEGE